MANRIPRATFSPLGSLACQRTNVWSPAGIIAAKAAGATVVAVTHTLWADILAPAADFVISSLGQRQVSERGLAIAGVT
jgi:hypothetical protein